MLNSCLGLFPAARPSGRAPLLPKLRGHFAEFLGNASPAGLGVLPPSTCVGLRYGCTADNSSFSWHMPCMLRYSFSLRVTAPAFWRAAFPPAGLLRLRRVLPPRHMLRTCVPAVLLPCSTGISTCCPSATRPRLALGPDLPRADQLYPGILGYSAKRIPTSFSLLIPAFSLVIPPLLLVGTASMASQCSSTKNIPCGMSFLSFGGVFQPRTFSARDLSTSELLRTL